MEPDIPDAAPPRARHADSLEHVHHGQGLLCQVQAGERAGVFRALPGLRRLGQPDTEPFLQLVQRVC